MKTVVYIMIAFMIVYLVIRYNWNKEPKPRPEPPLKEGERTVEEIMGGRSADEVYRELDEKEFDDLTDTERDLQLTLITHSEHTRMQASAVKELIENPQQIDTSNQYREPIDFTLRFYEKNIKIKEKEALEHLHTHFPLMGRYIIKKVSGNESSEPEVYSDNTQVNYRNCYNEFLFFIKHFFLKKYPQKSDRDISIYKHFPRTADGLIDFIER
ncbi:MAG TPA: hypothetical protein VGD31_17750 [Sphingobacteriaceae bacterium]